jgi:itaconate CoA-transferase
VTALQPPGHSSAYDPRLTAVPALGEHTEAILEDLGYSEAEIAEFRTALAI